MKQQAKLRVCASCEWIFIKDEKTDENGCPKCGFGHYGAKDVYGNRAYRYQRTQEPWFNKKICEYTFKLMEEIRKTNKILKRDLLTNLKNK